MFIVPLIFPLIVPLLSPQLHRLLRQQNLYKRYHKDTVNIVLEAINTGIDGPSKNFGYRSIHQKLRHKGIKTDRETVKL